MENVIDLVRYLGRTPPDPMLNVLFSRLSLQHPPLVMDEEVEVRCCSHAMGIELVFRKQRPSDAPLLWGIRFYDAGHLGVSAYAGSVVDDITLRSRQEDLIRAFGAPRNATRGNDDRAGVAGTSVRTLKWDALAYSLIADVRAGGQLSRLSIRLPVAMQIGRS
ncbi:hypothetical protein [Stenotrophomonas sp. PD6]|uniref:hypothetical protein n=1 Tax=Stenotrophomonas sp. PD6 TaxID=3368612 RepID=UPI003BA191C1